MLCTKPKKNLASATMELYTTILSFSIKWELIFWAGHSSVTMRLCDYMTILSFSIMGVIGSLLSSSWLEYCAT